MRSQSGDSRARAEKEEEQGRKNEEKGGIQERGRMWATRDVRRCRPAIKPGATAPQLCPVTASLLGVSPSTIIFAASIIISAAI